MAYLEGNRRMVRDFVDQQLEGLSCHAPQATYLAWIDCRARALELDPFRFFLERARVALSDGRAFGADGAGFVRLNFATSRPILRAILDRLAEALAA
jgi:cystathionine beta-lyase